MHRFIPQSITSLVEIIGYRAIYLPPYSPELNQIENFCAVKRRVFQESEDLKNRISQPGKIIKRETLHNIAHPSVDNFQKGFNKEPF